MTLEITVSEDHISHARWASWHRPDDDRADAIITAIRDAGINDVKMEIYSNLIPPNHNWGIWINGKRYAMTYDMRRYYSYFRIENGKRTEPAVIQFSDVNDTVDVQILPPDNRTPWEKEGMSREAWMDKDPYTQAYREARRMSNQPGPLLSDEAFEHWKKLIRKKGVCNERN